MQNLLPFVICETALGVLVAIYLGRRIAVSGRGRHSTDRMLLLAAMVLLTLSSLTFNLHILTPQAYGDTFYDFGDYCAPLSFACLFAMSWRRFVVARNIRWPQYAWFLALFAAFVSLVFDFGIAVHVLRPTQSTMSTICNFGFWIMAAANLAILLPLSLQTLTYVDSFLLQSQLLIFTSSFATLYHLADQGYAVASYAEIGWALGFVGIGVACLLDWRREGAIWSRPARLAEWFSVRVLLGTCTFVANLTVLAGLLVFRLLKIENGSELTLSLMIVFCSWFAANWLALLISNNLRRVHARMPALQSLNAINVDAVHKKTQLSEFDAIVSAYNQRVQEIKQLAEALIETERKIALGEVAAQVAHDIRSPLAALGAALSLIKGLEEGVRLMLRDGIYRIQDIANDLLQRRRDGVAAQEEERVLLVSAAIEQVVSERRMQYRGQLRLSVDFKQMENCYDLFVGAPSGQLKRIVSNLVNNAVEAVRGNGCVNVELLRDEQRALINITDNGAGMSPELLAKIGKVSVTAGKRDGNGIGIYQAAREIESWGGRLSFASELGQGTTATIDLPIAASPAWFRNELNLQGVDHVVILDDDVSVHRVWKDRFNNAITVKHCSTAEEFRAHADKRRAILYLVDYELIGSHTNGLALINELGIEQSAVLVTSHFEERKLIDRCLGDGVQVVPKFLAASVVIKY